MLTKKRLLLEEKLNTLSRLHNELDKLDLSIPAVKHQLETLQPSLPTADLKLHHDLEVLNISLHNYE